MRRLASGLFLGVLVAGLVAPPALARASQVGLVPVDGAGGGGTAVINNTSEWDNLDVTIQLRGAEPYKDFIIYLFRDCVSETECYPREVGTITTNGTGRATYHFTMRLEPGVHLVGVDVMGNGPVGWRSSYHAPGFTGSYPWGIQMAFS